MISGFLVMLAIIEVSITLVFIKGFIILFFYFILFFFFIYIWDLIVFILWGEELISSFIISNTIIYVFILQVGEITTMGEAITEGEVSIEGEIISIEGEIISSFIVIKGKIIGSSV